MRSRPRSLLRAVAAAGVLGLVPLSMPAAQAGQPGPDAVRQATARFHSVSLAEAAGYADSGLPCFDDPSGGMGFHYLKGSLTDAPKATAPEALVYAPGSDGLRLVAVEYLVDYDSWSSAQPPELFGQQFHELSLPQFGLHLWELHAWIWRPNPAGTFADFNPAVAPCP